MEKIDLNEYLASNEYPGRGIAVAKAPAYPKQLPWWPSS